MLTRTSRVHFGLLQPDELARALEKGLVEALLAVVLKSLQCGRVVKWSAAVAVE